MNQLLTPIRHHSRETQSGVVAHWKTYPGSFNGLSLQEDELDCGDYDLGGGVRVERKSAMDFNLAIMDKRLFGEVAKLKASADHAVYIVEGDLFTGRFHSDPQRMRESLAWMTVEQCVALVPSASEGYTAELLFAMANTAQHGLPALPVLRNGKPFDPRSAQMYVVEGLPGINPLLAQALLTQFGHAGAVFSASAEQLAPVIGLPLAQRVRKILDAQYIVKT
jgi:Fanconi anemia group M protein